MPPINTGCRTRRQTRIGAGYAETPRPAQQNWAVGQIVNVGFVRGLVVQSVNADGSFGLWQPSSNRRYVSKPHAGPTLVA